MRDIPGRKQRCCSGSSAREAFWMVVVIVGWLLKRERLEFWREG